MNIAYRSSNNEESDAVQLLLQAEGIPYRAQRADGELLILVDEPRLTATYEIITAYLRETNEIRSRRAFSEETQGRSFSGMAMGVVIFLIHIWISAAEQQYSLVRSYGSSAKAIMGGEVFRAVTALFLHADLLHLMGNCIGIALFGTAVVRQVGFGVGWFLILVSGIAGNLANAWVHHADHLSIGSSTALFGGVGALTILQLFRNRLRAGRRGGILIPIGGGLALLAVLGSGGQRTDLLAHLFGFAAGAVFTVPFAVFVRMKLARRYQWSFVGVAGVIIAAGWLQVLKI